MYGWWNTPHMAVLSDGSILDRIESGSLKISPIVDMEAQLQPGSFDIRLGPKYTNKHTGEEFDARERDDELLVFEPNTFYLAHTLERVEMPADLSAEVTGRSSIGREGAMIHITAGWVDAGFEGDITLEVYLVANEPLELAHGQRVGQLVFHEMDKPAMSPYGEKTGSKYQNQEGPTEGRLDEDVNL